MGVHRRVNAPADPVDRLFGLFGGRLGCVSLAKEDKMNNEPYKYCVSCGTELTVTSRIYAYNAYTGFPEITYDYDCPKRKRWMLRIWQLESHPCTECEAYVYSG